MGWDWNALKERIAKHGVRNSLLIAPMPTASTAQILGNNESIEPYTSNIYSRGVLSGDFQAQKKKHTCPKQSIYFIQVVNPHLMKHLVELNLWSDQMKNRLIAEGGSVQNIPEIPAAVRELYKTVWEISQRDLIQMAVDRAPFIDQSQSLNLHIAEPTYAKLSSMHFFAWESVLYTVVFVYHSSFLPSPLSRV
jgi:ribonucleoside-diphosphate reductase subunit M1